MSSCYLTKFSILKFKRGGPLILTTFVNIILGLRLYALYHSSKLVLALIMFLVIGVQHFAA
ncbi:hypothetical protein GYMLUDRAFT_244105 [Collybiopsis luxurians FD-317 M1]|uniref:Uncharacterized protein n=1 Tax=Collybiopsis luxurians FD-317 M1 TaxID=944289 RepID=A0A0D0CEK9_9AGAR|nr:hypothetical protein GYMLUDRAFT_244105 [Collybiopsis luxurians FD-317 M1]